MFRPISAIGHRVSLERKSKDFIRNKVVRPASILKPADKLKLYHKENKELFGPLLETTKQKKQRLKKEGIYHMVCNLLLYIVGKSYTVSTALFFTFNLTVYWRPWTVQETFKFKPNKFYSV